MEKSEKKKKILIKLQKWKGNQKASASGEQKEGERKFPSFQLIKKKDRKINTQITGKMEKRLISRVYQVRAPLKNKKRKKKPFM